MAIKSFIGWHPGIKDVVFELKLCQFF